MKVLHIIATLGAGGAEKMLVDIVEEMQNQNIQVELLVLSKQADFFSNRFNELGIPIHFGVAEKVYHPVHIKTIYQFMKKGFNIIHLHLFAPQLFAALASKLLLKHPKLITTEHSTSNRRRKNKWFKCIDRWIYKQFDHIVTISEGTRNELVQYLPEVSKKATIIENGIKIEQYEQAKSLKRNELIYNYKEGDKIVLMVAAMREEKDHETVIRASNLLPNHYHIVFVGDGERMKEVQKYARKNGSSRIHFLGRRTDIPAVMKTCDIFVLSSHWEGFGLVAVEAMAAGLPLIASDVAGLREIVNNKKLLFMKESETELAQRILSLQEENYKLEITRIGYERSRCFDIESNVKKLIDLYKI